MQASFRAYMNLLEAHHASTVFANGRGAPPKPPRLFKLCRLASKAYMIFFKPSTRAFCLQMGGGGLRRLLQA